MKRWGSGRRDRRRLSRPALVAAIAAIAAGCSDAIPEAERIASSQIEAEAQLPDVGAPLAREAPAAPDALTPPSEARRSAAAPIPSRSARARASTEASRPPAEIGVPLGSLLRAPRGSGPPPTPPLDLSVLHERPAAPEEPAWQSALDRWKDRLRVQRRLQPLGVSGARQGAVSQTEAGLRVPLDDSVSLEGGIRVDQRTEPGVEEPQRSSSPRVGMEVRF